MSESGGFLKFNITLTSDKQMLSLWFLFTQGLCWKYYNKPNNLIVIPSNTIILSSKIEKKHEKYQNLEGFFQILTHSNYKQTSGIQLEFFTQGLWWEY